MHGHTHRPADYDGNAEVNTRRIVLGDWKPNHAMVARFDGLQLALEEFT
jgi:UDP-2,3-diacylglucosamine pyrophosphatase LpxH